MADSDQIGAETDGKASASSPRTPPRRTKPLSPPKLDHRFFVEVWPDLALGAEVQRASEVLATRRAEDVSILTWNVWFDTFCQQKRQLGLLLEVLHAAPDIVCFQEVVPGFATAIWECNALNRLYKVSKHPVGPYGVMIMARHDLSPEFKLEDMPSGMHRQLQMVTCRDRLPGLVVANVHLESLNNEALRCEQLQVVAKTLHAVDCAVLCGDFNFDDTRTWGDWRLQASQRNPATLENNVLRAVLPQFVDVWPAVNPHDPGYSFDGQLNGVCCSDSQEQMRYDRILAKGLQPRAAQLLGKHPINDWGVCPSDHFGLVAGLKIVRSPDA
mmetsp:Transcript_40226/g.92478  ORF Transcript_40226/g.92478 Transcript_40226/m.92478 type:complete len:328 (-) Transcript_40226:59-1042(-)